MSSIPISKNDRVFVLTGAGISSESGLPTFRASVGLWAGHRVEDVCAPEALELNPELVWRFYSERREQGAKAAPNPAHVALAELEAQAPDAHRHDRELVQRIGFQPSREVGLNRDIPFHPDL